MKKFFTTVFAVIVACISLFCLFGCGNSDIEGKYLLTNSAGQEGGPVALLTDKDENGSYKNINHGEFAPENFWVEIKGDTMTVHGLVTPVAGGGVVKFNVNADSVRKIENFKLETYSGNENWYSIFDSNRENTLWRVLKDGDSLVFQFGEPGGQDFWYNISYDKVK